MSLIIFLASLRHFSRCNSTLFNPPEIPGLSNTNSCVGVARDRVCSVVVEGVAVVERVAVVEGAAVELLSFDEVSSDEKETKDRFMIIDST